MYKISKNRNLSFFAILLFIYGCGYSMHEAGVSRNDFYGSIAIPMISGVSILPGFEVEMTRALREQFISNTIPVVSEQESDFILECKIFDMTSEATAYNVTNRVINNNSSIWRTTSREKITLHMDAKLIERSTGRVVWHRKDLHDNGSLSIQSDPLRQRDAERNTYRAIADNLAERVYALTVERF